MARHYATRDFFRQIPNPLLARYFHARGVFADLDIAALPEPQPDALWAAWLTLDDTQCHMMDGAAFQDIAALSGEKGYRAILDDAAWQFASDPAAHAAFVEQLAALPHHGARAMTTFLDHPACWRRATRFFHAEALPAWRKRTHVPQVPAAVDEASLQALAAGLSTYFRRTEGRGTRCVVEPVRRGALDYFFAYPEDYSQHSVEWVDGQFGQRPHHPAFKVIYVYSQQDGTLDVNIRGARTAVEPLQGLFAATILKQAALPPDPTASCPKTQTNSRLARRAVSIVIAPWRAPDLGRVGGDVGDSASPHAQGKHRPATGCHAPGRRPGSRPWPHLDQNVLGQLRRGSPGLDSGPLGRPLFRRCTALSAARHPI